jgi:hypothetical protein
MNFNLALTDAEVALAQMLIQKGAETLLQKIAGQCQEQSSPKPAAEAEVKDPE